MLHLLGVRLNSAVMVSAICVSFAVAAARLELEFGGRHDQAVEMFANGDLAGEP